MRHPSRFQTISDRHRTRRRTVATRHDAVLLPSKFTLSARIDLAAHSKHLRGGKDHFFSPAKAAQWSTALENLPRRRDLAHAGGVRIRKSHAVSHSSPWPSGSASVLALSGASPLDHLAPVPADPAVLFSAVIERDRYADLDRQARDWCRRDRAGPANMLARPQRPSSRARAAWPRRGRQRARARGD